jgi:tetratricopeptide (TPR) repeat protein
MTGSKERLKSDETNSNEISSAEDRQASLEAEIQQATLEVQQEKLKLQKARLKAEVQRAKLEAEARRARPEAEVQRARLEAERAKLEAGVQRARPKKVWLAIIVGLLLTVIIVASLVYILVNAYTTAHRNELATLAAQVDSLKSTQQPTAPPQQPTAPPPVLDEQVQPLAQDVQLMKIKVESELEASRKGIEAIREANDQNFRVFVIIGGVATAFGLVTLVTTWLKGRQEHQDYKDERKFYEDRATEYETRRQDEHKAILQLYGEQLEARQEENKYAGRMFALQEKNLEEVNTITTAIAAGATQNVDNLNTMLATFKRIMDFKVAEAKDVPKLVQEMKGQLEELRGAQRQQVEELLRSAVRLRRPRHMYASPDPDLQRQMVEFRTQMDLMQRVMLDQHTGVESPAENRRYGEIYLRRGVIAYYDNDMPKSREMLEIAERFYPFLEQEIESMPRDQKVHTAFTQFYLAFIQKNYGTMTAAKEHIEKSYAVYGRNEQKELLTPTTRAEILSYLRELANAQAAIQEVLDRAKILLEQDGHLSQHDATYALRVRLFLGNTCYVNREWDNALQHYQEALEADVRQVYSYYIYHSIAQVYHQLGNEEKAKESKRQAYNELLATDHLRTKVALDTRILLNALAYLCTREDEPEKAKEYRETVRELWLRVLEVNGLQLRLFSFEKKQQVSKDEFWTEVFIE